MSAFSQHLEFPAALEISAILHGVHSRGEKEETITEPELQKQKSLTHRDRQGYFLGKAVHGNLGVYLVFVF